MTNITIGDTTVPITSKEQMCEVILAHVLNNTRRQKGIEVEAFVFNQNLNPISRSNGQRLFKALQIQLAQAGYSTSFVTEKFTQFAGPVITAVNIDNVGLVTVEPGHQIEMVTHPDTDRAKVIANVKILQEAVVKAATSIDHKVLFQGYSQKFAALTEGGIRQRDIQWNHYYSKLPQYQREILRQGQFGTASTQYTLDSGADQFHRFWSAAQLTEVFLAFVFNPTPERLHIIREGYGKIIPSQVLPVKEAWLAESPRKAIEHIVERYLDLHVPFMPDEAGVLIGQPLQHGTPPQVRDFLDDGRLTSHILNNVGGFLYSAPAFRNISKGLIEIRSQDSIVSIEQKELSMRILDSLIYNDRTRETLLNKFEFLGSDDIDDLNRAPALLDRSAALDARVGYNGHAMRVIDIINTIAKMLPHDVQCDLSELPFFRSQGTGIGMAKRSPVNGGISEHHIPAVVMAGSNVGGSFALTGDHVAKRHTQQIPLPFESKPRRGDSLKAGLILPTPLVA